MYDSLYRTVSHQGACCNHDTHRHVPDGDDTHDTHRHVPDGDDTHDTHRHAPDGDAGQHDRLWGDGHCCGNRSVRPAPSLQL